MSDIYLEDKAFYNWQYPMYLGRPLLEEIEVQKLTNGGRCPG